MSRLFVGQRVRVVAANTPRCKRFIGCEARILTLPTDEIGGYGLDIDPVEIDWERRIAYSWFPSQLEPILPEGHKASEYSLSELLDRCREGLPA